MITIELDDELSNAIEKLAKREHKPVKQFVHDVLMGFLDGDAVRTAKTKGNIMDFAGVLKDSPSFQGNPLDIQKAMRDEWD